MAAWVPAMVEPLPENGLIFQIRMGYTEDAMDTAVTREVLEHILRTMLQVVTDAYYRAGYLTTEYTLLEIHKNALEKAIIALHQETSDTSDKSDNM